MSMCQGNISSYEVVKHVKDILKICIKMLHFGRVSNSNFIQNLLSTAKHETSAASIQPASKFKNFRLL